LAVSAADAVKLGKESEPFPRELMLRGLLLLYQFDVGSSETIHRVMLRTLFGVVGNPAFWRTVCAQM
jgi:hypothetical protein